MKKISYLLLLAAIFTSCTSSRLETQNVSYQSVRIAKHVQEIPTNASIIVAYGITPKGELTVAIRNNTSNIMIIDQEKSFLVNSDGISHSYYDPSIKSIATTEFSSSTNGSSVNLGAVAGAFGVNGALYNALSGINIGGSTTTGTGTTSTVIARDLPKISIAPKGTILLSKAYPIEGIGIDGLNNVKQTSLADISMADSPYQFKVCISYSTDDESSYNLMTTNFYVNSLIFSPILNHGQINNALRQIYQTKTDALNEEWYILYFDSNKFDDSYYWNNGIFKDYQF